jgi:hypothetical protein
MSHAHRLAHGPAALALALVLSGPARAQEASSIFSLSRAAVAAGRVERTTIQGFSIARNTFDEVNVKGGVLIGFDLGFSPWFDSEVITALRPIYRTPAGISYGRDYGRFRVPDRSRDRRGRPQEKDLRVITLKARPGYAVGKVQLRTGLGMDAMALQYHKIVGQALEPHASSRSEWVGNLKGGSPGERSSDGGPIVGVHGNLNDDGDKVIALGLIYVRPGSAAAPPPPADVRPAPEAGGAKRPHTPGVKQAPPPRAAKKPAPVKANPDPPAEADAEPPANAAAPAVKAPANPAAQDAAEADDEPAARVPPWLPLAVFGGVFAVIFLPVMVILGRKKPAPIRPRVQGKQEPPPTTTTPEPSSATGICTSPGSRQASEEAPPYFTVLSNSFWQANRLYRAYVLPDELLLIDAGPSPRQAAGWGATGGLVGGLVAWRAMQESKARQEGLDRATLDDLRALACQGHSWSCRGPDLLAARLEAPSWWETLSKVQGRLRLSHAVKGEVKFQFLAFEDMHQAVALLPEALGARVDVNVVLDRLNRCYVRKT